MPPPGSHVGEYSIVRRVAVGATSEIYEGRHRASGEPVAVKVLRPEWCLHVEVVARFLNEAQALQELRHPHLVRALASGTLPQGAPFMVLEWLPVDLHQLFAEAGGRLPLDTSTQIILQLAGALDTLHTHGLIHRDLKPANVLLVRRETRALLVKLADLGLAKHTTGGNPLPSAVPVSTAGSAILGTWDYMAPEQWIQSKSVGPKADVYALGVLWFQLLAGRLPFVAGAEKDLMYHHLLEPPPLELLGDQVPEPTRSLVARMLSKKTSERPTSREIQELLPTAAG
jgi:serine/threonine protein kinase